MIEDTSTLNDTFGFKRRIADLDLASNNGSKRGRVFSYFPSVDVGFNDDEVTNVTPTAEDYANLIFCSSDNESEEEAVVAQPVHKWRSSLVVNGSRNTNTRRPTKRRLHFGALIPSVHELPDVAPSSEMTPEEKSNAWINLSDLEQMKSSAQYSISEMRTLIIKSTSSPTQKKSNFRSLMLQLENDTGSSIRGLEHRVFRRRQPRSAVIKEVLECQSHINGLAKFGHKMSYEEKADLMANASRQRSRSAVGVALTNARHDFEEL